MYTSSDGSGETIHLNGFVCASTARLCDSTRCYMQGDQLVAPGMFGILVKQIKHRSGSYDYQFAIVITNSLTMACPPVRGDNPRA